MHFSQFITRYSRLLFSLLCAVPSLCCGETAPAPQSKSPNIVVIFIDDMGYADIGPFGARAYSTPHLDQMAREGRRLTDFLVSTAVCSASRAALMTGCYHARVDIHGAFGPKAKQGIHADEVTLGELCKSQGYATACFGKWHLGDHRSFLPLQNGFDEYLGLPYSNDMWPSHPTNASSYPALPLLKGNDVVDAEVTSADQAELTRMYTEHAVDFIERHAKQPFFLYVPHSMVHVPIFASTAFAGKSGAGPYGDVVMEIDWSVGQILATLRRLALDRNTLVLFTSDNGPWLSYGNHAGNAGPLREGKGTMWEGGVRVPTIAWWPGTVPANTTCDELCATIDVLPTVAKLIGAKLPAHRLDGLDISPLLRGDPHALSPHEVYWGYYQKELQMVRDRQWKLVLPHRYRSLKGPPGQDGKPNGYAEVVAEKGLYDLKHDLGEQQNLLDQYPEIAARLEKAAAAAREELGDRITNQTGSGVRPAGKI